MKKDIAVLVLLTLVTVSCGKQSSLSLIAEAEPGVISNEPVIEIPGTLALVQRTDSDPFNFGSVSVASYTEKSLTLSNSGTRAASALVSTTLATPFSITANTCSGGVIAIGSSCTITVRFSPTVATATNASLNVSYFNGVETKVITSAISGTGIAVAPLIAVLQLSDANPYNFGSVTVSQSMDKTFTISNSGSRNATALTPAPVGAPFSVTASTCMNGVIATGTSCTITVRFSPTAASLVSGSLAFSYFDGATTQTVTRALSGIGVLPLVATLSLTVPSTPNFQGVGTNPTIPPYVCLDVTNIGTMTATEINPTTLTSGFAYSVTGSCQNTPCQTSLLIGQVCSIPIEFKPVVSGMLSSIVRINYKSGVNPNFVQASVSGSALARNCKEIHIDNAALPSDEYTIRPDANQPETFSAYCDMSEAGGGWTLVLNYLHKGGTNPNLNPRTNKLPLPGSSALGIDESAQTDTTWMHSAPAMMSKLNFNETRFFCKTSNTNSQGINFYTNSSSVKSYFQTGMGAISSFETITNLSPLSKLPNGANTFYSNKGDLAMTEFPFFWYGLYHWSLRGVGSRWDCDDVSGTARSTYHQIWVR